VNFGGGGGGGGALSFLGITKDSWEISTLNLVRRHFINTFAKYVRIIRPSQQLGYDDDVKFSGYIQHIEALENLYFSKKFLIKIKQGMETCNHNTWWVTCA
jgi:hypothetical protein